MNIHLFAAVMLTRCVRAGYVGTEDGHGSNATDEMTRHMWHIVSLTSVCNPCLRARRFRRRLFDDGRREQQLYFRLIQM